MFTELKRFLVGKPIATEQQSRQRLNKVTALAVFSSDALSSVAYATEAILAVLLLAGATALKLALPISGVIVGLLIVVGFSYRQTIHAYPNGGGAYIVARDNLGEWPSLVAAAALLIDYVLTVAVSVSAGVAAIVSLASAWGWPALSHYAVPLALGSVLIIALANLRGVRESGAIFAVPTYVFVGSILLMIAVGVGQALVSDTRTVSHTVLPSAGSEAISVWLVLRAFAAGCTALTGVEAISNGVPAFKPPESRNAAITLIWMVALLATMFLGIGWLADRVGAIPNDLTHETVLSQVARTVFGVGPVYTLIQVATALILVLAANTAFADFPRLASLLGRDGYLPRQLTHRGDRLVFSNGILVLAGCAALLIIFFHANEIALLPLYAVGVFLSFTLSQSGMVRHHLRLREARWRRGLIINGLGALLTAIVLLVLSITKFIYGAWVVLVLLPALVLMFRAIHRHYSAIATQLALDDQIAEPLVQPHTAILLVGDLHRGILPALNVARSFAPNRVTAVTVAIEPERAVQLQQRWRQLIPDVPLVVLESPYRSLVGPLLSYIDTIDAQSGNDLSVIVIPEFVPLRWWEYMLHNQTAFLLRAALLLRKRKIVVSVPYELSWE
ncbi:APC family permease [Chloroflexus sp.]|uniref:APC family permease n=1 Tax=Chloroflexus sp. TaxID=1904827 RepID=UPI00298F0619|nr:APC family permease [Chloroflexus sp.]MDW8402982.1 APC family permease [Chloroflexus sp.]